MKNENFSINFENLDKFGKFLKIWTNLDKFGKIWKNLENFGKFWKNLEKFDQSLNEFRG